jgi:hypothetical protein
MWVRMTAEDELASSSLTDPLQQWDITEPNGLQSHVLIYVPFLLNFQKNTNQRSYHVVAQGIRHFRAFSTSNPVRIQLISVNR